MKEQLLKECLDIINAKPFSDAKVMIVKYRELLNSPIEQVKIYRESLNASSEKIHIPNTGFKGSSTPLHGTNVESKLSYDEKVRVRYHNNHLKRDFY